MKAIWNGQVLAESDETVVVESNHYFPADSINSAFFTDSAATSFCPWKGQASYYDVEVNGEVNEQAAWYYPSTSEKARHIQGMIAFWRGGEVVD